MVGVVKISLRKALGRKLFTYDQLQTILTEVEAIVNTRPLTFVYGGVESRQVLTPMDFLVSNRHLGVPTLEGDHLDPDFSLKHNSADALIDQWKKGQKRLDQFWTYWRDEYLLSLRERPQIHHKKPRIHSNRFPQVGEVVLVKDENQSHGSWRLGCIIELITGADQEVHSARVRLPNHNIICRAINLLFPLEVKSDQELVDSKHETDTTDPVDNSISTSNRPIRQAATHAKEKIRSCLTDEAISVAFQLCL